MAGLNFDITANNSDFLKKTEEIKNTAAEMQMRASSAAMF